jgi:hypothetical protein
MNVAHEQVGFVSGTTTGTVLTTTATGAKGSWVQLSASTARTWEYIVVQVMGRNTAADYFVDIAIGSAGNEFAIIQNLRCTGRISAQGNENTFYLPLHVPAGSAVSARASMSTSATGTIQVMMTGYTRGPTGAPGYAVADCLWTISGLTGVVLQPATLNTKTAWTQSIASTTNHYNALMAIFGGNADIARTAAANMLIDVGLGAAASETMLIQEWPAFHPSTVYEECIACGIPVLPMEIAAGSRLAVRVQSNNNTAGDRDIDICLYGFR